MNNNKHVAHSDDYNFEAKVKSILMFRKITKVTQQNDQTAILTLDNGMELVAIGNTGCGGCGNGWYYLDKLNNCDNAITDVRCVLEQGEYGEDIYRIYVFADNKTINCLQFSGSDNGYYGTGYDLYVRVAK